MVYRIAIIMKWGLSFGGGGEKWITVITNKLLEDGYEVTFYIPDVYLKEEDNKIPNVTYVFYRSNIISILKKLNLMNFAWPFIKIRLNREYDTIYIPSFYAIRLIIYYSIINKFRIILDSHDFYLNNKKLARDFLRIIPEIFLKISNKNVMIRCVNDKCSEEMLKYGIFNKYIPNFPYSYGKNVSLSTKFRILFINRINKRKGGDILIDIINTLKNYNDTEIIIAGYNDCGDKFINSVNNSNNCKYLGYISENDKINLLEESDVFILLSNREAAAPLSQLEAMASGLFVISTWKWSSMGMPIFFLNNEYLQIVNRNSTNVIKAIIKLKEMWSNDHNKFMQMKLDLKNRFLNKNFYNDSIYRTISFLTQKIK
ncbi:glycosyltransferase family 4 protein [Oxyplasma meridianum]|uniref:Glycosyltransferase family 4 protein n=1 Tax=Oxyplasma meridianum TaxID=3073602 RepID=A0AAX4NH76_9ARCH